MVSSLVEVALRALLVAAAVWAGLRILGLRDVLAQKTAWVLVLAAAFLMPILLPLAMRWQVVPAGLTLAVPPHPLQAAMSLLPRQAPRAASPAPAAKAEPLAIMTLPAAKPAISESASASPVYGSGSPRSTIEMPPPMEHQHAATQPLLPTLETLALSIYLAVCGALLVRLLYGLTSAIGLWIDAEPVALDQAAGLRVRVSRAVSSPVTIGSGVVLPASYDDWESDKLRIVLAHERSHIRQGDFYLQILAGLYCAMFWFSPLGWWLKRKLSDLGEAISDRAGVEEAASRSSYAQILLEFAAAPRPTLIGVAMARSSSLSHRIERLLNDSSFRQAFRASRRRALAAMLLVPAALFAATAFLRVQAAVQDHAPVHEQDAAAQPQAAQPVTGQSHPDDTLAPVAPEAPSVAPPIPPAPAAQGVTAIPPGQSQTPQSPAPPPAPGGPDSITIGRGDTLTILPDNANTNISTNTIELKGGHRIYLRSGAGKGFAYSFHSGDEDSYALVTNPTGGVRWSGEWHDGRRREIEKASQVAHGGKFLWFEHDGKSYVVDDPSIVANIEAMYKPIDDLGRKQEELGKQQEALGRQQEELGRRQEQITAPAPDVSAEIAKIDEALAKLKAKQGKAVTQEELSDLQEKMGDLQGKLGDIEGKIGEAQGRLGEEQGKLGEQQGKLGEEQGRLGEEQGRIAEEADRKVREIIQQSLTNGKAKPVE